MVSIANTLAGALQTNVFAVQRIQSEIDSVQARLSTGLRVNSALDNPVNFFLSRALSSRAARLSTLLDGIVAKVAAVQQADESVTSLSDLVGQLKTVAEDAAEVLTENPTKAEITGSRNLGGVSDLPNDLAGVDNGDRLVLSFVDTDGSIATSTVTIANGDSTNDLLAGINAITDAGASQVFEATLNSAGQLNITTQNNERFGIDFQDNGGAADSQLVSALGFGGYVTSEVDNGVSATRISVSQTPALTTTSLFDRSTGNTASLTTTLLNVSDTAGGAVGDIFNGDADDALQISVDGGSAVTVVSDISTATIGDLVDGINNNGSLNTKIAASFDAGSGELSIRTIDSAVESIQVELLEDGAGAGTAGQIDLQQLGIGTQVLLSAADGSGLRSSESLLLGPGAGALADLQEEFDDLRTQIDDLVGSSEFDNVNLLNDEDLVVLFGETGTSSLTVEGATLTAQALGVNEANFANSNTISDTLDEVTDALDVIETFSNSLANDLSIIETRRDLTGAIIANLGESINNLTAVDEESDSALLLALEARKNLSVTVLGLASENQISVLRTF